MHYANEARFKHLKYRVALCYRNFAAHKGVSHIGLGVSANSTAKVLRKHGIQVEVWPINSSDDIRVRLGRAEVEAAQGHPHVTHVVISAPWIPIPELAALTHDYTSVEFFVNCHSNVGFLMADASGMAKIRSCLDLETGSMNFHAAGNSRKFCEIIEQAYGDSCAYLPNLYYIDHTANPHRQPWHHGSVLRVGSFGAIRALKNFVTAGMAAIRIARELNTDLEFWVSAGRNEGGHITIVNAIEEAFRGLRGAKLVKNSWESWPAFRRTVAHMDLMLQVSYTESFNVVTADAVAEGVPVVVSEAIEWLPQQFKANADDTMQIARVGHHLLFDPRAPIEALDALRHHNSHGVRAWLHQLRSTGIQTSSSQPPIETP